MWDTSDASVNGIINISRLALLSLSLSLSLSLLRGLSPYRLRAHEIPLPIIYAKS